MRRRPRRRPSRAAPRACRTRAGRRSRPTRSHRFEPAERSTWPPLSPVVAGASVGVGRRRRVSRSPRALTMPPRRRSPADDEHDPGAAVARSRSVRASSATMRLMRDLTFGVFVPQGWKMELAGIADPEAEVGQGRRDRRARRGARLRLALGLRPLPQRAGARRTRRCSSAGRRWPRISQRTEPHPARADGAAARLPQPGAAGQDHRRPST